MNSLIFKHTGNNVYSAYLNDKLVDSCEINKSMCVTQAHLVIASAWNTVGKDLKIDIQDSSYTMEELLSMAQVITNYVPDMLRIYR